MSDFTYQTNTDLLRRACHLTDSTVLGTFYEYLTSLREFHKGSRFSKESVKVGDVVLLHDDKSRVNWKLALVTSINRGRDGLVRFVNLRTASEQQTAS